MENIFYFKIGQSLPPEEWFASRDRLSSGLTALAEFIRLSNHAEDSEASAQLFLSDARIALVAIDYVAHFATENCRYIAIPIKEDPNTPKNPAK